MTWGHWNWELIEGLAYVLLAVVLVFGYVWIAKKLGIQGKPVSYQESMRAFSNRNEHRDVDRISGDLSYNPTSGMRGSGIPFGYHTNDSLNTLDRD